MRLGLRGSVALPKHADRYTDSKNALVNTMGIQF